MIPAGKPPRTFSMFFSRPFLDDRESGPRNTRFYKKTILDSTAGSFQVIAPKHSRNKILDLGIFHTFLIFLNRFLFGIQLQIFFWKRYFGQLSIEKTTNHFENLSIQKFSHRCGPKIHNIL